MKYKNKETGEYETIEMAEAIKDFLQIKDITVGIVHSNLSDYYEVCQ
jgi:hypothetical protein